MTDVLSPQTLEFISSLDVNDPEYARQLLRPADIKEDVKLMEQRRRVSLILQSPAFRKELEKIVASQMRDGVLSPNVMALKQLVDILTPHAKLGSSAFSKEATVPVIPINDLRFQSAPYSKPEKVMRCKVASTYRLVDIFGWATGTVSHVSARVFKDGDSYLFNPQGLLFNEISASSLVKVDIKGKILDGDANGFGISRQGWALHASVYEALPTIRCVIQLSIPAAIAVSCMSSGLLPISQEAMMLGAIATYDPSSAASASTEQEKAAIRESLLSSLSSSGEPPRVLLIRKCGILAMGKSVEEAWMSAYLTTAACESQLRLAGLGMEELVLPSAGANAAAASSFDSQKGSTLTAGGTSGERNWRPGELEFEALMRRLDAAGYCTGHLYRIGQVQPSSAAGQQAVATSRGIPEDGDVSDGIPAPITLSPHARRAVSLRRGFRGEVEVPPAASSFAANFYKDDATRMKEAAAYRAKTLSLQRTHWHNTPNVYQREEIEEVGTNNPKKITKWTEGESRTIGGTLLASEDPNQFAPQGQDPRELKQNLQKVRDKYYKDVRTAGPKSKVLEGLGLDDDEEADGTFTGLSTTMDSRDGTVSPGRVVSPRGTLLRLDPANPPTLEPGHVVVVGAVSKGIINRDQRHNVGLFQSVFSPNPFDQVTDDELERYKRNVERKARGLPTEEEEEAEEEFERQKRATLEASVPPHVSPLRKSHVEEQEAVFSDTGAVGTKEADESKTSAGRKKRRFKMPPLFARRGKDRKSKAGEASSPPPKGVAEPQPE